MNLIVVDMELIHSNQSVTASGEMLLTQQNSLVSLTKRDEPTFVAEIRQKYGSLDGVLERLPFDKVSAVGNDVKMALTANVPSFVRLDRTFGKGSSKRWLFVHIKSLLLVFGIDSKKMDNIQIVELAEIITARYPWLKLTEFMLFEAYFMSGQYGRFFGENSYFLVLTQGILKFLEERNQIYARLDREAAEIKAANQVPGITWEEFCRSKGIVGEPPPPGHLSGQRLLEDKRNKEQIHIQQVLISARGVIAMKNQLSKDDYGAMCYAFRKRYGSSPEKYIATHEEKSVSTE